MSLEGHAAERITFGVDSGAALTVIGKDVVAEYPRVQGHARRKADCQGNPVVNSGQKDLALRGPTGRSFARVTVASVAKNLLSVSSLLKTGHEVVFSSGKSYIRHLKTGARQPTVETNGVFEVSCDLSPYAVGSVIMTNTVECVDAVPLCPVDCAPRDQGQEEQHEAAVRAGGASAPEHESEDVGDLEQQARERPVRVLRKRPEQPTAAEVQEHEISSHEPYRSCCRACVAGRGRADAHVGRPGVENGVPISGVEYGYLWSRAPEALDAPQDGVAGEDPPDGVRTSSPVLCGRCSVDRWLFGHLCQAKGDNGWNRALLAKELQAGGYPRVVVRSDGEPALLAHVRAARAMTQVAEVARSSARAGEQGAESREWACGRCSQRAQGEDSYFEAQHRDGSWEANPGDS